jgi:hypothetical protein
LISARSSSPATRNTGPVGRVESGPRSPGGIRSDDRGPRGSAPPRNWPRITTRYGSTIDCGITVFQSRVAARPETRGPAPPSCPGAGALALHQGWPRPRPRSRALRRAHRRGCDGFRSFRGRA